MFSWWKMPWFCWLQTKWDHGVHNSSFGEHKEINTLHAMHASHIPYYATGRWSDRTMVRAVQEHIEEIIAVTFRAL